MKQLHLFDLTTAQMVEIQSKLREQINIREFREPVTTVCGVDLAYFADQAIAVLVMMDYATQELLDITWHQDTVSNKYVPGLLAFRELPIFLAAWEKRQLDPDLVFFDGNGILHPKRVGLATHASFFIDKPTIGIAKTPFIGTYEPPGNLQGDYAYIYDQDEIVGAVLRTQTNVKPVFVSIGNRVTLQNALDFSMHFVGKQSRIPEITRQADIMTRKLRKEQQSSDTP